MDVKFYGKMTVDTIRQLIQQYKKNNLKEVIICMNGSKYEDRVAITNWLFETGDYYLQRFHISAVSIDSINVYFLLSPTIPYDYIKSYPIYTL